jgi:hypothetical protein
MKAQLPKAVVVFFAITITVLAFLSINNYFRGSTKDYAKWFLIGETVLKGGDIYAPRGDGTFQFIYPPVFYLFCMPSSRGRTKESDALEYAMLLLLILIFTPLAFTYFFVWLLYPLVVALSIVLSAPQRSLQRIAGWSWLFASLLFLCFTFPFPAFRAAQAAGSTLMACLLLLLGIGWKLRAETRNAFSMSSRS